MLYLVNTITAIFIAVLTSCTQLTLKSNSKRSGQSASNSYLLVHSQSNRILPPEFSLHKGTHPLMDCMSSLKLPHIGMS